MDFFHEPATPDPTWARPGESVGYWVSRSSLPRAAAIREFVNYNLQLLPEESRAQFRHNLRHRWDSALLELIVARCIQLHAGTFDVEQANAVGRRADFLSVIKGRQLVIEAVAPKFDIETTTARKADEDLLRIIEPRIPPGWGLVVRTLPRFKARQPKSALKAALREFRRIPPPATDGEFREFEYRIPHGTFAGTLLAGSFERPYLGGPAYAAWHDSAARILKALRSKRQQIKSEIHPVVLAVNASGSGSSFDDFDRALFGSTVSHVDRNGGEVAVTFDHSGILSTTRLSQSYSGVLAFVGLSPFGVKGPVLYLHPDAGHIAELMDGFETRVVSAHGIRVLKPEREVTLAEMRFAQP